MDAPEPTDEENELTDTRAAAAALARRCGVKEEDAVAIEHGDDDDAPEVRFMRLWRQVGSDHGPEFLRAWAEFAASEKAARPGVVNSAFSISSTGPLGAVGHGQALPR